MSDKVFCSKCSHFNPCINSNNERYYECLHPANMAHVQNWHSEQLRPKVEPWILNEKMDCTMFEKNENL